MERRDGDPARYGGAGVLGACQAVESEIAAAIGGKRLDDLAALDRALIELDGTSDKHRLGANALLAVSQAGAYALAASAGLPLHRYLGELGKDVAAQHHPLDRATGQRHPQQVHG